VRAIECERGQEKAHAHGGFFDGQAPAQAGGDPFAVHDLQMDPIDEEARPSELPQRARAGEPVAEEGQREEHEENAALDDDVRRARPPEVVDRVHRGRVAVEP
jgi:hypothetical protein